MAAGAIVFFVGSTVLWTMGSASLFVSPDETANHWFIRTFAQTGKFHIADPLNTALDGRIHPRSMAVIGQDIVPVGFLGLPTLYGLFASVLGMGIVPFLTPVIALCAVFAFRALVCRWFDERIANITTLLFLFHPALWYYTARFLMPNVLFVSLLIFSAALWFVRPFKRGWSPVLSGVLAGLAIFVRASEAYWVGALVVALAIWKWNTLKKGDLWLFVMGGIVGLLPFFLMNALTYGSPLTTGYTLPVAVENAGTAGETGQSGHALFPFGLDWAASARHIVGYGLALFWWMSALAAVGFVRAWKSHRAYAIAFVCLALWLGVWYGSWTIHDNPDPTQVTIANSYVRYWLPVFVLSVPFAALALVWLSDRFGRALLPACMACVMGLGVWGTFLSGQDGLFQAAETLRRSEVISDRVLSQIEPESVMIVDRSDKLFFPHRVVYPLRSEATYALMPRIVELVPLYYYGITFPTEDLEYLNGKKLKEMGLQIELVEHFSNESLYKLF